VDAEAATDALARASFAPTLSTCRTIRSRPRGVSRALFACSSGSPLESEI
jgi:hypothetical protein